MASLSRCWQGDLLECQHPGQMSDALFLVSASGTGSVGVIDCRQGQGNCSGLDGSGIDSLAEGSGAVSSEQTR